MHEIVANIHMHTTHSDGSGSHAEIAEAAIRAGLDVVIVTDHNVLVDGVSGYYGEGDKRVLLLVGEEVHDVTRQPQKNHMLIFNAGEGLERFAKHPQQLVDEAAARGGLTFLAHPVDMEAPLVGGEDISWVDWEVHGYHGIELWNAVNELKPVTRNWPQAYFHAFFPEYVSRGPFTKTLAKWDELLSNGQRVAAIGGSDAHAWLVEHGPVRRKIFPYEFHFRAVNTHLLLRRPFSGEWQADAELVYEALGAGRAFIGYELPYPTKGFYFNAQGGERRASMGEGIPLGEGVTLRAELPLCGRVRLLRNGEPVYEDDSSDAVRFEARRAGVYRLEAYQRYKWRERGWIFSNPIYVVD